MRRRILLRVMSGLAIIGLTTCALGIVIFTAAYMGDSFEGWTIVDDPGTNNCLARTQFDGGITISTASAGEADKLTADLAQINTALSNSDAMAAVALSEQNGNGLTANNQLLKDYHNLSPVDFERKYGEDTYLSLVATAIQSREFLAGASPDRTVGQHVSDYLLSAGNGVVQTALSLTDLVVRVGSPTGSGQDWLLAQNEKLAKGAADLAHSMESRELGNIRHVDALRSKLEALDGLLQEASKRAGDDRCGPGGPWREAFVAYVIDQSRF